MLNNNKNRDNILILIATIFLSSPIYCFGGSTSNARTTGQVFQVNSEPPMRIITGTVKDENDQPVKGALIFSTMPAMDEKIITDSEGKFRLRLPIMMGTTSTRTSPMQMPTYIIARQKERNLANVIKFDDQNNYYEIKLSQATILSGKIVDVNGIGIMKAETSLGYRITDRGITVFPEPTKIDANGVFEMRAVPQGFKYLIYANAKGYGQRYVELDLRPDPNEKVDLQPIILELANLSVSGIVVDQMDQGARISTSGNNGQPSITASGNTPYDIQEIRTNAKGEFKIEGICPGELFLEISKDGLQSLVSRARVKGGDKDIKIIVPSSFGMPAQVERPSSNQ